jgi:hypothetical protein
MLGFQGPAQPPPAVGGALNAGYFYREVKCLGCNTHQAAAHHNVCRSKFMPIHDEAAHGSYEVRLSRMKYLALAPVRRL